MNNVLPLIHAARNTADPTSILYSDHMLAELLALHEDMIEQLRLERLETVGNLEFLTTMIDQHEKTAAMLRAKLESHRTENTNDGVIVITGVARAKAQKSAVTKFARGADGANPVRNQMTVAH